MTEEQGNAEVVSEEQVSIPATEETPTSTEPQLSQDPLTEELYITGSNATRIYYFLFLFAVRGRSGRSSFAREKKYCDPVRCSRPYAIFSKT